MTLAILIFSSYIGIIALSFALTLVLAIFVATQLYVHEHEQAAGDLQHQGTVDGQLVFRMNFSKWRSGFSLFQSLDSLVYSHALDYYLVVVFLLCVVTNSIYNRLIVPFVMVFITFQLVPSLKRFAMKEWSNSAIITTMNLGNSSMFFFMFPYTLSSLLRLYWKDWVDQTHLNDNLLSYLWLIIVNCLLNDLVKSRDYKETGRQLGVRQDIEKKFLALFQTYTENESVILHRVNLISKLSELNDIEKNFWKNINSWKKLEFDSNYWHHSLDDTLKIKIKELKKTTLDRWTKFRSNVAEFIYEYCHKRTSNALFEDSIYVIMDVVNKNRTVLQEEILNFEEFFHGDLTKFKNVYNEISSFYHYLRNKAASPNSIYKEKYDAFVKQKDKHFGNYRPSKFGIRNVGRRETYVKVTNKDPNSLKKAADLLTQFVLDGTCGKVAGDNPTTLSLINSEKMVCDFGEYRFYFHTLSEKLLSQSQGYQKIKFSSLVQLLLKFFIARIEFIVAFFIILTQVYKGGLENLVILGIIFFGILIETHLGHAKLWSVIYFIYLVKTTISYQMQSSSSLINEDALFYKILLMVVGTHDYIIDSLTTLAVFSLIQVLKSRGFSDNFLITFEDVGTALARVNLF
jgi:hypothetical protein